MEHDAGVRGRSMGCGASAVGWSQDTVRDSERSEGVGGRLFANSQSVLAEAAEDDCDVRSQILGLARLTLSALFLLFYCTTARNVTWSAENPAFG